MTLPVSPRLEPGEKTRLLRTCRQARTPWLNPAVELAIETAMRRGELLNARYEDLENGLLPYTHHENQGATHHSSNTSRTGHYQWATEGHFGLLDTNICTSFDVLWQSKELLCNCKNLSLYIQSDAMAYDI
jgi:hypothetical protein